MTKRMLIDSSHPEETRVAVLDGNRLEAFDFETATKKQLKGNIYLAKVTRVEPSLQACFVEYGGNRQGFLAFSEIHPDYYQIPVADREALMAEEDDHEEDLEESGPAENAEAAAPEEGAVEAAEGEETEAQPGTEGETQNAETAEGGDAAATETQPQEQEHHHQNPPGIETVGGDEAEEMRGFRRYRPAKRYKIQEVIKRRQILLVQVVKEERGGKGAAVTTYVSLAGRYCVLMPNSAKGGVSRKINSASDRKRLRSIISDLNVPDGMAVILRTAGADRPKTDIKRDCDYLLKQWDEIREKTLQSTAPSLIYEEGSLVKRAIRDLYAREMEEVIIEGDEGYKAAKNLMKMLTPSHAKRVQQYKDRAVPLFQRFQVERQIDSVHDSRVELPAGGYIIINQTEALVAVDVNSGRSTRERNIEETAVRTNLEAAEEIARQMRLRDLAGLIVIDFIDMEHHSNKHLVERKFKEFVRRDRARMQIGRISHFGLLEMTRQRLRPSVQENIAAKCPTCNGSGFVRSTESSALYVLRAIEDDLHRRRSSELRVFVPACVGIYLLNHKRATLHQLEEKHYVRIVIEFDDTLVQPAHRFERVKATGDIPEREERPEQTAIESDETESADETETEEQIEETSEESSEEESREASEGGDRPQRHHRGDRDRGDRGERRGRRGRRGGRNRNRRFRDNNDQFGENRRHNAQGEGFEQSGEFGGEGADDNNDDNFNTSGMEPDGNRMDAEGGDDNNFRREGRDNRDGRDGRERGGRRRRGRNRFRRDRDHNRQGGGEWRDGNQAQDNAPGGMSQDSGESRDYSASGETSFGHSSSSSDEGFSMPREAAPQMMREREDSPQRPSDTVGDHTAPALRDEGVAVVTGSPENPKRGWWRRPGT